jgi:hypothetical protein
VRQNIARKGADHGAAIDRNLPSGVIDSRGIVSDLPSGGMIELATEILSALCGARQREHQPGARKVGDDCRAIDWSARKVPNDSLAIDRGATKVASDRKPIDRGARKVRLDCGRIDRGARKVPSDNGPMI